MTGPSLTISVDNKLEELERIYALLDDVITQFALGPEGRNAFMLVTEELFANTVRHGYDEGAEDVIQITADLADDRPRLTINDGARYFDISEPPRLPDADLSLEDMEVGGLGLLLIHEFAHSIAQRRNGDRNVTEIVLKTDIPD